MNIVSAQPTVRAIFQSITIHGAESIVLDCVKRGEDDEDVSRGLIPSRKGQSVILRVYDSLGGTSRGSISCALHVKRAWKTNVLEDDEAEVEVVKSGARGTVAFELRPFEVATFRLQL